MAYIVEIKYTDITDLFSVNDCRTEGPFETEDEAKKAMKKSYENTKDMFDIGFTMLQGLKKIEFYTPTACKIGMKNESCIDEISYSYEVKKN